MRILQRWFNSTSYRNLLTITGLRYNFNNDKHEYEFEPFFEYRIGPYKKGHTLYFSTRPSKLFYHREIFAKMMEYYGSGLIGYLDYHYKAYADKREFLRFLRYETLERIKHTSKPAFRSVLEQVLEWIKEEDTANTRLSDTHPHPVETPPEPAMISQPFPGKGKIQLNNQLQLEKYIQLQILIKDLKTPGKDGEYLFKNFSSTDVAGILCQFENLGELRLNTLQKKVADAGSKLHLDDPRVEKLTKALQEFFYR